MVPQVKKLSRPTPAAPIGIFDSGIGGLSILEHLRRELPRERFEFLADQSYVPYGDKSAHQLKMRTTRINRFFLSRGAKLVVVACNTATCYAIDHMRKSFPMPFIGTVPAVKPACAASETGSVAVISTPATARSEALTNLITTERNGCRVTKIGCPGLEEAVEHGSLESPQTRALLRKYLARAQRSGADQLVLGCTHYPFLKAQIQSMVSIPTIDSGAAVARQTRSVLTDSSLLMRRGSGRITYWTTGDVIRFEHVASLLLGKNIAARALAI